MLSIDATFLVTFFIIWVLVFVLTRILWKPMLKAVNDRESKIQGDRAAAKNYIEACEKSLQDIEATIKSTKVAAEKTREALEVEALKEKVRLLAEVSAVSKDEIEKATAKLNEELVQLKRELQAEGERLAGQIEQRLLN
jgi:F-type H+-transporting ATPase subunit b